MGSPMPQPGDDAAPRCRIAQLMRASSAGHGTSCPGCARLQPVVRICSGMMTRWPRRDAGIGGCWVLLVELERSVTLSPQERGARYGMCCQLDSKVVIVIRTDILMICHARTSPYMRLATALRLNGHQYAILVPPSGSAHMREVVALAVHVSII